MRVVAVLFEGFELLDVFGPLEVMGVLPDRFEISITAPAAGTVVSAQGPAVVADTSYADAPQPEIVLVPGGIGTRRMVEDHGFLEWLADWGWAPTYLTSVCTGSGVLAAAGLLEGYSATSNKKSFGWASAQGNDVRWIPHARWVEDGNRWTSSGVAAGIDMTLALVSRLHGRKTSVAVADGIEYEWHEDQTWDPFAAKFGLFET